MSRQRNPKMKIARKMLSRIERENHTPPFLSEAWTKRFRQRQAREIVNQYYIKPKCQKKQ